MNRMDFNFKDHEREQAWAYLHDQLEHYYQDPKSVHAAPSLDLGKIQGYVGKYIFEDPIPVQKALDHVIRGMRQYTVHTPHPGYYGLYNPRPVFPGILADTITATFNPQLAAWSHAPFANEVENYLVRQFGLKFGLPPGKIDGVFTSGGAEANLTALLTAINHKYPGYGDTGLLGLEKQPVLYCSEESHHSVAKAAKNMGLGLRNVRPIPTNDNFEMQPGVLEATIEKDLAQGLDPFLVVATAGTTGTGVMDPLEGMAAMAKKYGLWFHVDAAYGGAIILVEKYKHVLNGIELADSITFDAHKWMSNPMSTSLYITAHPDILSKTFGMATDYMPKEGAHMEILDPYSHSIQWSRRFIGLRLYLSLLVFGWKGYAEVITHQIRMGKRLKELLLENDWNIYNQTDLPVICFGKAEFKQDDRLALNVCSKVLASGKAWISVYRAGAVNGLRACITNYDTQNEDLEELVEVLNLSVNDL